MNDKVTAPVTITFLRKGYVKHFYLTENEEMRQLLFLEAVEQYLLSQENDKKVSVTREYYDHLEKNKQAFDQTLNQVVEETFEKAAATGNDAKVLKILKSILKCKILMADQETKTHNMIELWENGEIAKRLTNEIVRRLKDHQGGTDEEKLQLFNLIAKYVPDSYFEKRNVKTTTQSGKRQIILSCYMIPGGKK